MPYGRIGCGAGALLLLLGPAEFARSQSATPPATKAEAGQPFRSTATAVVVDVVVRDRNGAPILDLTRSDFEILEDGRPQRIGEVTLATPGRPDTRAARPRVGRGTPSASVTATPAAESNESASSETDTPTLVALVFHRMSPEARALSHRAALAYLETPRAERDFAGVFLIDQILETVQTYTTDRGRIREAITAVASRATSTYARSIPTAGGTADRDPRLSPTASAESPGRPYGEPGNTFIPERNKGGVGNWKLEKMRMRMEEEFMAMARDQQGLATTNGLVALVRSLGDLPGRKTVVFFAEGLSIPPAAQPRFQDVIDLANRSNVSLYTMDAAGLRVHSEQAATARAIGSLGLAGVGRATTPDSGEGREETPDSSTGAQTKLLEKNEFVLREDPRATLSRLATETGGFFIDNTNDLAGAFRRIDADRRFHYLLTYSPANASQDGVFRRITVKVRRAGAVVRSRTGYYATRGVGTLPALHFETAAIAALDASPRPADIPIRALTLRFPSPADPGRLALIVSVPASGIAWYLDRDKASYWTNFTILTRLVDEQGEVVRKGSQPYHLTGQASELDRVRAGDIVFYRQPSVPPGRYTFDYVVHDALGSKAGAGSERITVEPLSSGDVAMSSLVLVQRTENVPASERDPANPLYLGELLLYPRTGEAVSKTRDRSLPFFYTLQPQGQTLRATLTLLVDGHSVANVKLTLPSPDSSGRIQHLAQLPLASVPEGECELRVTIEGAGAPVTRTTTFTLVP
jgi:VWFA-related protein